MEQQRGPVVAPGLCGGCTHARQITSERGSVFILCELSFVDKGFPKYPRLPVAVCSGYEAKRDQPGVGKDGRGRQQE